MTDMLEAALAETIATIKTFDVDSKGYALTSSGYVTLDEYGTIGYTRDITHAAPMHIDLYTSCRKPSWVWVPRVDG